MTVVRFTHPAGGTDEIRRRYRDERKATEHEARRAAAPQPATSAAGRRRRRTAPQASGARKNATFASCVPSWKPPRTARSAATRNWTITASGPPANSKKPPLCQHVAVARPGAGVGQRRAGDPGGGAKRRCGRSCTASRWLSSSCKTRSSATTASGSRPCTRPSIPCPPCGDAAAFRRASSQYRADGDTKRIPIVRSHRASEPGNRVDRQGRE